MKKKMLFDKNICPKVINPKERCVGCVFWETDKAIRYELIVVDDFPWNLSQFTKNKEKPKKTDIFVLKMKGCAVMIETCPECIMQKKHLDPKLKIIGANEQGHLFFPQEIQRLIPNPNDTSMLWCSQCKRVFRHDDVAHAVNSHKITEVEYPELYKKLKSGRGING